MLEEMRGAGRSSLDGFHSGDRFQLSYDLADAKSELFPSWVLLWVFEDAHLIPGDLSSATLGLEHMHP